MEVEARGRLGKPFLINQEIDSDEEKVGLLSQHSSELKNVLDSKYPRAEDLDELSFYERRLSIQTKSNILPKNERLIRGMAFLQDGIQFRSYRHELDSFSLRIWQIVNSSTWRNLMIFLSILQMSLVLFEPHTSAANFALSYPIPQIVDFVLTLILLVDLFLFSWAVGFRIIEHHTKFWRLLFVSLYLVHAIISLVHTNLHYFPLGRILRPILLIFAWHDLKRYSGLVLISFFHSIPLLLLMFTIILVFAAVGHILFSSIQGYTAFTSIRSSIVSLFVLLTTANFPDVMMGAYDKNYFYSFYFIVFCSLTTFLFVNLLLAQLKQMFSEYQAKFIAHEVKRTSEAIFLAFNEFSDDIGIDLEMWINIVLRIRPKCSVNISETVFVYLRDEKSEHITLRKFFYICRFLGFALGDDRKVEYQEQVKLTNMFGLSLDEFLIFIGASKLSMYSEEEDLLVRRNWKGIKTFCRKLDRIEVSIPYNFSWKKRRASVVVHVIDLLIKASMLLSIVSLLVDLDMGQSNGDLLYKVRLFDLTLLVLNFSLFMIKLVSQGFKKFSHSRLVFSFIFSSLSLIGRILIVAGLEKPILNLFTCVRLLSVFPMFSFSFFMLMTTLSSHTFLCLLFIVICLFYEYALIGIALFKDKITNLPLDSQWKLSGYQSNNFNNFPRAIVTLFELLMVNNWHVFMNAGVEVTSEWCRLYFISFYVICPLLMMHLLIAFILDTIELHKLKLSPANRCAQLIASSFPRHYLEEIERFASDAFKEHLTGSMWITGETLPIQYSKLREEIESHSQE